MRKRVHEQNGNTNRKMEVTKGQQNKLYEAEEYNSWTKKFNRELHTKVGKTKESFQKTLR